MPVPTISPTELFAKKQQGLPVDLLDVRTPAEYNSVHAEGARLVPLDSLEPGKLAQSRTGSSEEPLYFICKSGGRSAKAVEKCQAAGFTNGVSVSGGTSEWERLGLPVVRGARTIIPLDRQMRIAAGALVLLGVILGGAVSPLFYYLSGFVGAGLVFAGITDICPLSSCLAKAPWNQ